MTALVFSAVFIVSPLSHFESFPYQQRNGHSPLVWLPVVGLCFCLFTSLSHTHCKPTLCTFKLTALRIPAAFKTLSRQSTVLLTHLPIRCLTHAALSLCFTLLILELWNLVMHLTSDCTRCRYSFVYCSRAWTLHFPPPRCETTCFQLRSAKSINKSQVFIHKLPHWAPL